MKKVSVVRFKPKPGMKDEFLAHLEAFNASRADGTKRQSYLVDLGEEIMAVAIRDADIFEEDVREGVAWLDKARHMLEEYNADDRNTIAITGTLIN